MKETNPPIQSQILSGLRDSEQVRNALQRLLSGGKRTNDDVEKLALQAFAPIEARLDAVTVLLALEQGRTDVLRGLLETDDRLAFIETLKIVKHIATQWAIPELIRGLRTNGDPSRRTVFAWALAAFPEDAEVESVLLDVIARDDDSAVRDHAIESLSEFKSARAVEALLDLLGRGSANERFWALYSLGTLADPRATEAVRRCLQDYTAIPDYGTVADEAKWALARIEGTDACRFCR